MNKTTKIAIDGPAGAGKSTVAKILADKLGYIYIDTGAMYRALTLKIVENKVSLADTEKVLHIANDTIIYFDNSQGISKQRIICDGKDVTEIIRTPEITEFVSRVAKIPIIRDIMVDKQRSLSLQHNVIMDGRDIGTVVLPDADYKFFLIASLEERAKRRSLEMKRKGYSVNNEEILQDIYLRDKADSERNIAPLKPAEDSIIIDTSLLSIEDVVNKIFSIIIKEE